MYSIHDYNRDLQYKNKSLQQEVDAFKSGAKYIQMEAKHKTEMSSANRTIKNLKKQVADLNCRLVTNRNNWIATLEEEEKAHIKELEKKDREITIAKNQSKRFFDRYEKEREKKRDTLKEMYALKTDLDKAIDRAKVLEAMVKKDSTTSDKPASTDLPFTKAKATSTREKTDKSVGGQPGHKGHFLEASENPDIIVDQKPSEHCPFCNGEVTISSEYDSRQTTDVIVQVVTTEERAYEGTCCNCGQTICGKFSEAFTSPVSYGPSIRALVATLNANSNVTINKTVQLISDITNGKINMSHGTVVNIINDLSKRLEPARKDIANQLASCGVLNVDETGFKVSGDLKWIQIIANGDYSLYARNATRSIMNEEMDRLITLFTGTLVHDHLKSYYSRKHLSHSECNSHGGRYLTAVTVIMKHPWAQALLDFLIELKKRKASLEEKDIHCLDEEQLQEIRKQYLAILDQGQLEYEDAIAGKEHIKYYDEERRLLKRLREYCDEHLRFIINFEVPYSNNLAELGARHLKMKLKSSGGFRSNKGCDNYTTIASVIASLRKQHRNVFPAIYSTFLGKCPTFNANPEPNSS